MENETQMRMSRRVFGLGLAGAAVAGSTLIASDAQAATSGVMFVRHQVGTGKKKELQWFAKSNGWLYMPGGFMVMLEGGHILRIKKVKHHNKDAWKITLARKFSDGTLATHQNGLLYASYNHITYTVNNGRRRVVFNKEVMLHWRKSRETLMHRIWIKKGSVFFKNP